MNLEKIPKIKKLAEEFGNPLIDAQFIGEGVIFHYKVGKTISNYYYSDVDRGIEEEISRLEKLLAIEV